MALHFHFGGQFGRSILTRFWHSILAFNFGSQCWQSVLELDFGARFCHLILALDFGVPFWYSILALDFGDQILMLSFGA